MQNHSRIAEPAETLVSAGSAMHWNDSAAREDERVRPIRANLVQADFAVFRHAAARSASIRETERDLPMIRARRW